jgi:hypothetical protein
LGAPHGRWRSDMSFFLHLESCCWVLDGKYPQFACMKLTSSLFLLLSSISPIPSNFCLYHVSGIVAHTLQVPVTRPVQLHGRNERTPYNDCRCHIHFITLQIYTTRPPSLYLATAQQSSFFASSSSLSLAAFLNQNK